MTEKLILQIFGAIVSVIIGYLTATVKNLKSKQLEQKERQRALENGVQALLKQKILEIYDCYKDSEEVPADVQECMTTIYSAYHGLGGNGTGTRLHSAIINKKTKV